jgi:hypothetical protein
MNPTRATARLLAGLAAGALLVVPAVDAAKKKPPQKKGATYTAFTSQGTTGCRSGGNDGQPCSIFVGVTKDGTKVNAQLVYFFAQCDDGKVFRSSTAFRQLKISAKGKYSAKATYNETLGDGSKAVNTVVTHGQFKHVKKKYSDAGDYSVKSDLSFTDGTSTHCESGKVTFNATTGK